MPTAAELGDLSTLTAAVCYVIDAVSSLYSVFWLMQNYGTSMIVPKKSISSIESFTVV